MTSDRYTGDDLDDEWFTYPQTMTVHTSDERPFMIQPGFRAGPTPRRVEERKMQDMVEVPEPQMYITIEDHDAAIRGLGWSAWLALTAGFLAGLLVGVMV